MKVGKIYYYVEAPDDFHIYKPVKIEKNKNLLCLHWYNEVLDRWDTSEEDYIYDLEDYENDPEIKSERVLKLLLL